MAYYNGYVTLPITNYAAWKAATNGNGFNADGAYGCQCWDLAAEFWYNAGFGTGYPHTGPNQAAYECWTVSRVENASNKFDLITNVSDIKQGDVLVFNQYAGNPYGHIGFADEDYNGTNVINILSENNGGTPDPAGGTYTNVNSYYLTNFLGAFRYKDWHVTPPTPTVAQGNFKWYLYIKKLNNKRLGTE